MFPLPALVTLPARPAKGSTVARRPGIVFTILGRRHIA